MDLQAEFEQAYNQLAEATRNYRGHAMIIQAEANEREAAEYDLFQNEIRELETMRNMEADLRMKFDLAQLRVDHLSKVLRIMEIIK